VSDVSCGPLAERAQAPARTESYCIIVDDDPGICRAIAFTLHKLGFETSEAASPAALRSALVQRTPQLIFLDLGLGQSGALDVLPILADRGYRGFVQLMSGRTQETLDEVSGKGDDLGLRMLPALPKPFRMGTVKELVGHLDFAC
jgi:DNA-binding response OmpR family regulator